MRYRLCILAAGQGTRLSSWQMIHKALLPVGNKGVISHIIDGVPREVEIVIACGYKSDQIKNFIALAHPERKIIFVDVDQWMGEGSGPGYSLLACRPELNCPFVFTSADTLVGVSIPDPSANWIGVAGVEDTRSFLVAEVKNGQVTDFFDKVNKPELRQQAFIGMAGVYNWEAFWETLANNKRVLVKGELQVANGLGGLIASGIMPKTFTWHDTGTDENYEKATKCYSEIVARKENEFLYMQGGRVIKFFADQDLTNRRVARAKYLRGVVPKITGHRGQFYAYDKVPGHLISEVHDVEVFKDFLKFCQESLWNNKVRLVGASLRDFQNRCDQFYRVKTMERVRQFCETTGIRDNKGKINGVEIPELEIILGQVDWDGLSRGVAACFHGDLQPENIIVTSENRFSLIDWRQDFAGLLEYGDVYYDLAKLDHALLINGRVVREGDFSVDVRGSDMVFEFYIRSHLIEYREIFHEFIVANGFDLTKVKVMSSIIYLNIAPLHHSPYNKFLFYIGKYFLHHELKKVNGHSGSVCEREAAAVAGVSA